MNKLAANIHCISSAEERFGGAEDDTIEDLVVGQEPQRSLNASVRLGDGS